MPRYRLFVVPLLALAALPASALEVRVLPQDRVYLNHIDGGPAVNDLVVHGIRLHNDAEARVMLEAVEIEAIDADGKAVIRRLAPAESRSGDAGLEAGADAEFGPVFLTTQFAPSELVVTARFSSGGESAESRVSIPVVVAAPDHAYGYPLRGSWYMRGIPSAMSHHRWNPVTEFAVDFFKVDDQGRIVDGDPVDAANYYGYGEPVLAAADGVVETVIRGMTQDRAARLRGDGESDDAFRARIGALNQAMMREHGLGGATGNLVVIRHADGERSAYGHLKTGSVLVSEGDTVTRGQTIAEVGDTGDSEAVHLHFQVSDGPFGDGPPPRSIPFRFENLKVRSHELGSWVEPAEVEPAERADESR